MLLETGSQFKRVMVACDEKEKPTHLEALRALRAKLVSEHMCATHCFPPPSHPIPSVLLSHLSSFLPSPLASRLSPPLISRQVRKSRAE